MIAVTIIGMVILLITAITFPFVSIIDYILHGELTKDYIMKVYEWLDNISNKFEPRKAGQHFVINIPF